ncbi:MAG: M28 family peptidase [Polyangiales bacterium]
MLSIAFHRYAVAWVAPLDAPASEFSGARARAVLARVLGDERPHPTGSRAAADVRARIAAELATLGLAVETQRAHVCGRYGTCAEVENLVATIHGTDASGGAVLFVAHSDSVPRGPGASDDGAGVAAVLEGARALLAGPKPKNDVILLIDDGEELGLLGAEAFVREDPLHFLRVRAVVNVEARGVRGPATLFQTGSDAGFLVDVFARAVPRPIGSSLFSTVYERMPNDTDLTVFLQHDLRGLNFAFSDGPTLYHTAEDDLAHQNPGSVQHLGESAFASVRALANADLRSMPKTERVYFDLFGALVVRWPTRASIPLAAGILLAIGWASRRRVREVAIAAALFAALTLLSLLVTIAILFLARPTFPWVAHPEPFLFAAVATPIGIAALLPKHGDRELGTMLFLAAIGLSLAIALPGASYPLLAPLLVWTLALALPREARVPLAVAAGFATWALILRVLYPALGLFGMPGLALGVAFAAAPLWPLLRGKPSLS